MAEKEKIRTRSQQWAERAFERVTRRAGRATKEYVSFTKSFPALIHTCGLVQALAFAQAKDRDDLLEDLANVLDKPKDHLMSESREADTVAYLRLSRDALAAAGWLKRYVEALLEDKES